MKQFVVKESVGTNDKLDYVKINAETESVAKKIYKDIKGIKRMKSGTSIYEISDWNKSMTFNATVSANKKHRDVAMVKLKFVESLTAVNN